MFGSAGAGILSFYMALLLFAAEGTAPRNNLLETLTRPRKVCEEGGLKFQPNKNSCGRFYECGLVGLARHYVSNINWSYKKRDQIRETTCRNAPRTTCLTRNSNTATFRKGSIAGIGRDAIRRREKIA